MAFPTTRLTLIRRLAAGGSDDDWARFVRDYWGPVHRFALRRGAANRHDAEEVAAMTFEAIWSDDLLSRWLNQRSAKLRTLVCAVVRKILANRERIRAGRRRLQPAVEESVRRRTASTPDKAAAFYAAWVEELVGRAVQALAAEYLAAGQAVYIRAFYGRLCEGMTIAEVADALGVTSSKVDYYYRDARDRLSEKLASVLRPHVEKYSLADDVKDEFESEWRELGDYLARHGGLEEAVRRAVETGPPTEDPADRQAEMSRVLARTGRHTHRADS